MAVPSEGCWAPRFPCVHAPSKEPGDSGLLEATLRRTVFPSVVSGPSVSESSRCQQINVLDF